MRKKYYGRFWFRILTLLGILLLYFIFPDSFLVLESGGFLRQFSVLHILWGIWILDMLLKLFPIPGTLSLGALKLLKQYYVPAEHAADPEKAGQYHKRNNRRALGVFGIWCLLGIVIGILWKVGIFGNAELFLITTGFYVCDLICVLFWCPFRVWFLKNRCCTTCRIFNWDHFMMFTPLLFVNSFYCRSLSGFAIIVMLIWEYRIYRYPERFYEGSNECLKCKNCTDHLCGKGRK